LSAKILQPFYNTVTDFINIAFTFVIVLQLQWSLKTYNLTGYLQFLVLVLSLAMGLFSHLLSMCIGVYGGAYIAQNYEIGKCSVGVRACETIRSLRPRIQERSVIVVFLQDKREIRFRNG
ncbi:hypothetical protein COOONC_05948, partial [Cooperia oncophora]